MKMLMNYVTRSYDAVVAIDWETFKAKHLGNVPYYMVQAILRLRKIVGK
jgi:hypothetical protein